MEETVLDLVKDKKISEFADIIKSELKRKIGDNEYIQQKAEEIEKYQAIGDITSDINTSFAKEEIE
jgi:hypothetical protein